MEGSRFDELTRNLAEATTRRRFARGLAGGVLGAVAGVIGGRQASAGPPQKKCKYQGYACRDNTNCCTLTCCNRVCCGDGQVCCNGQCVRACPSGQTLNTACTCEQTTPACTSAADCPPATTSCRAAVCVGGQCGFADLNGTACDDGNACTTGTICQGGVCGGTALDCEDGNPCTTNSCDPASGCRSTPLSGTPCPGGTCQAGACIPADPCAGVSCDDANPCTSDRCVDGTCRHTPVAPGTLCTPTGGGPGQCDEDGVCVPTQCLPGEERACYSGAPETRDVGVCRAGTQTCQSDGTFGPCVGEVLPSPEVCDGLDNDCDGVADENNPGGGLTCQTGEAGVCASGTTQCVNGAIVCRRNVEPSAEICDGLDNDCDGFVDEGAPCPAGQICQGGACRATCPNGVRDGTETDVDCGGPGCPPCPEGRRCLNNGDCQSGSCFNGICYPICAAEQQQCNPNDPTPCCSSTPNVCAGTSRGTICCRPSDTPCSSGGQCCSGICEFFVNTCR